MSDGPPTPRSTALQAILANDAPHPWERQANESEEEYELFTRYRDRRPPRGRVIGPGMGSTAKVFRMFQDLKWTERTAAYDRYHERIILEERAAVLAKSARDHAADALALLGDAYELAMLEFQKLLKSSQASDGAGLIVKPAELIKLMDRVIILTRTVKGEATEIVEIKGPDLSELTLEELDKLEELNAKIVAANTGGNAGPH